MLERYVSVSAKEKTITSKRKPPFIHTTTKGGSKAKKGDLQKISRKAEGKLKKIIKKLEKTSDEEVKKLVHELQGHQIELEMQNEELRRSQKELEKSRNKYFDLYDFAPIGYFTIGKDGVINEANFTGARMLGTSKKYLIGTPFPAFLRRKDIPAFYGHLKETCSLGTKQTCELKIKRKGSAQFDARLESIAAEYNGDIQCHVAIIDITELHEMQSYAWEVVRKKDESEAFINAIFQSTPIGVAFLDRDLRFTKLNKNLAEINGLPVEEHLGKRIDEIIPGIVEIDKIAASWKKIMKTGRAMLNVEVKGKVSANMDEQRYWLENWFPVKLRGETIGLGATVQDITERRRVQEFLRKNEEHLRLAQEAGRFGTFEWNLATQAARCSRGYFQVMGVIPRDDGEVTLAEWQSWIHPEDRERINRELEIALENSEEARGDYRLQTKDDEEQWINYHGSIERDTSGDPVRMIGTVHDITERKRVEKMLLQLTDDLNRAQAVGKIGSWRLDIKQNKLTWSDENHRIFGIPRENPMTYETFLSTVHPDDREYVHQLWSAALRGNPYDIEHRIVVNGTVRWVRERAELEFDEDGTLRSGFGTTQDITERKTLEQQLYEYTHGLEKLVQEQTQELRDLLGHIQEVREENRIQIARHIHDEFGTVLTGLKVDLSSLLKKIPDDPGEIRTRLKEDVKLIDSAIGILRGIISELRPSVLEHLGLAEAINWQVQESIKRTGISYNAVLRADDIEIDYKRSIAVFRIFQEALSNITRHAGATEIQISLNKNDGFLILEVADNGKGIPEEKLSDHNSFGLMGMRERVLFLGGTLEIDSILNEGTTVRIAVPLESKELAGDKDTHSR